VVIFGLTTPLVLSWVLCAQFQSLKLWSLMPKISTGHCCVIILVFIRPLPSAIMKAKKCSTISLCFLHLNKLNYGRLLILWISSFITRLYATLDKVQNSVEWLAETICSIQCVSQWICNFCFGLWRFYFN